LNSLEKAVKEIRTFSSSTFKNYR